ncbi:kinase-like domain-containing protein [Mycena sp. CBHHK59/15]|nr:kinase-like domain-containing protein [Mycena sp. CBHHK59/15]
MAEDEEDWQEYKLGGFHPVSIGDSFSNNRYVVVRKLGWGHFSTVWLARDEKMQRHVALKVVKSAPRYTETAVDEIKLLQRLVTSSDPSSTENHPGKSHVISFLDHFRHKGPNGTHVCMVFEVLGESLLGLIKRHQNKGVPIPLVKQIAKQILLGLDYMHRYCDVIHTDLKPENLLIYIPDVESVIQSELALQSSTSPPSTSTSPPAPHQPPHHKPGMQKLTGVPASTGRGGNLTPGPRHHQINVNITGSQPLPSTSPTGSVVSLASLSGGSGGGRGDKWGLGMMKISSDEGRGEEDLGMAKLALSQSAPASTSATPMRIPSPAVPPPLMLDLDRQVEGEEGWVEEVDVGAEDDAYEMITVKIADLGNATWMNHHFTNDIQTRQYRCPEVIIGSTAWGSSVDIWSVACVPRYSKDDDHMAQIIELLGELPEHVRKAGRWAGEIFDAQGKLLHIQSLRPWPLSAVLHDKYLFPAPDAHAVADFLLPMLSLEPEGARHAWLADVPDLEMESAALDAGHEADAMQPVDDAPTGGAGGAIMMNSMASGAGEETPSAGVRPGG